MNMKENKQFCVQQHFRANNGVHWDLMLEAGDVLETYRLETKPEKLLIKPTIAVRIFDHRLKYLTFEGDLSDDRGSVKIADAGEYNIISESEYRKELEFIGRVLIGKFSFILIEDDRWEVKRF